MQHNESIFSFLNFPVYYLISKSLHLSSVTNLQLRELDCITSVEAG